MRRLALAAGLLLAVGPILAGAAATRGPAAFQELSALARARELLKAGKHQETAELLLAFLRTEAGDASVHAVLGQALAKLGRADEAAFHLERALELGGGDPKERDVARKALAAADPLFAKREALAKKTVRVLSDAARKLVLVEDRARALELYERLLDIASREDRPALVSAVAEIRAATTEVKLDQASQTEAKPAEWSVHEHESKRYKLVCNLEPAVVEKLGDVMDDIFEYYIQVYFDGEGSKAGSNKATIRIHPSREAMKTDWNGDRDLPLGWWSPGEWKVVTYDTTESTGSLDMMLEILFHEASHHFMTMLAGDSDVPAWINEGTACFFEGAVAMADRRVLWPDVAIGRMKELQYIIAQGKPTVEDVVSYDAPGSYPGEYYPIGWGLVYFLQQYEEPTTLEYVYRPLYQSYRTQIIKKGLAPKALFEQVFFAKGAPGGFTSIEGFVTAWRSWYQQEIYPLFEGPEVRVQRLRAVQRYVAAADKAKAKKKSPVSEGELLLRALGHVEYVRTKVDGAGKVDGALLDLQAGLMLRLGRTKGAASTIEELLTLADQGKHALDPKRYEELDKILAELDSKNAALRNARGKMQSLAAEARGLLAQYDKAKTRLVLQSYAFAQLFGAVLKDGEGLLARAEELRKEAREKELLRGALYPLRGKSWSTIFSNQETRFETSGSALTLESVRPVGKLSADVRVRGEYEVRGKLRRGGAPSPASFHGLVVSGEEQGDWIVVGVTGKNQLALKVCALGSGGGVIDRTIAVQAQPEPAISPDEVLEIAVRVQPVEGRLSIRLGDRQPVEAPIPKELPAVGLVGVYVKDGTLDLESGVVEIFP